MDTMSLHMAISGLTGFQRTLWMASKLGKRRGLQEVKEHIKKAGQKRDSPMVCLFLFSLQFFYKMTLGLVVLQFQENSVWALVYRLALGTG